MGLRERLSAFSDGWWEQYEKDHVKFYDVRQRRVIRINRMNVTRSTFKTSSGDTRYGFQGKTLDGRVLTKFVDKKTWDELYSD